MKIGYTKNLISDLLLKENLTKTQDVELINLSQDDIITKIRNGILEGGLIDPVTYAKLKKDVDVRIIPTTCLFLEDFTNIIGLNITSNYKDLNKLSIPFESEYLFDISKIILNERYEIDLINVPSVGGSEIVFSHPEAILDISEDWFESFKFGLPMLFWVVKYEDGKVLVEDYINIFNTLTISSNEDIINNDNTRHGRITRNWDSECEKYLDETLELLFYNNLVKELHCSKIYSNEE